MKIAFLTSGGNAPCLNSSIGRLLFNFSKTSNDITAIGYLNGFSGLLKGKSIALPINSNSTRIDSLYEFGGSLIGNSRVKLTNITDCLKKGLIKDDEIPLEVSAKQLIKDKVDILFTIGGDDTNTTAKDLKNFINSNNIDITVIGIPKTIDNDIFPIRRSLGSYTAANYGAIFFENIVNENFMAEKHLIVHEVMGRNSGWLSAFTAKMYFDKLDQKEFDIINKKRYEIHGIYVPERELNFDKEIERLSNVMEQTNCLNLFVCEGAFLEEIEKDLGRTGNSVQKDAFGHVRLDSVNAAKWFSELISQEIDFDRILIQKSGYFSRSAAPNSDDLDYIFKICDFAFDNALKANSGVVGEDQRTGKLSCIDFNEIKGDKGLDINSKWFLELIHRIEK